MKQEIIKQTIKFGNSSGVILPNTWKNKKVRVQLVETSIIQDTIEILQQKELLEETIGIYLVGSYARGEETEKSDIDLLVITENIDKQIKTGNYEITLISKKRFKEKISKSLYLLSMVKEAKTLINKNFIKDYKTSALEISIKKYLNEISSLIKFNEEILDLNKELNEKIEDGTIYSLVLRLRELYLIDCLKTNKTCNKKDFLKLIDNEQLYNAYLRIKNNSQSKNNSSIKDSEQLVLKAKQLIEKINLLKNGKKEKNRKSN